MIKITMRAVFITTIFSFSLALQAQQLPKAFGKTVKSVNPQNGLIRCATTEYEQYLQEQDPKRETREQFEAWLAPKIAEVQAKRLAGKSVNAVITIPVVVHVIHNGDAVGRNENISDAQILSQITVLNQDYRRMLGTPGYNTNSVGADVEIEFCMAKVTPTGSATNGIDRVNLGQAEWADDQDIDDNVKRQTYWNPNKYFNIWTVNFGEDSDLLGYAQFPTGSGVPGVSPNGGAMTDGVVIGYKYFGSSAIYPQGNYGGNVNQNPYQFGRTSTHEIGHCLGLLHVCGDDFQSCIVNTADSNKDYCPDTPATKQYNYGCSPTNSCPSSPGSDMIENYMDYTDDQCMSIFTQNQKDRMVAVMNNASRRKELKTSTVCQAPADAEDFEYLNGINLYPNPATSIVNIAVTNGDLPDSFAIFNSLGQQVSNVIVKGTANLTVNTSGYSTGIYFIKVSKGNKSKTLKFIKQ